jgi:membrane protein
VSDEHEPSPWEFGGLGWRELARRTWAKVIGDDVIARAAQLSYFFIFSLFPLLYFLSSLLGYFARPGSDSRRDLLRYLSAVIPGRASELVRDTLDEVVANSSGGKLSLGLLLTMWTASFGVSAVVSTLNEAYGVRESRPWWKVQSVALGITLVLMLLVASALLLVLYGGGIGQALAARAGAGDAFTSAWAVLQWPLVLACVLLAFALVYYLAPDVRDMRWQWITPGSVLAVLLWLLVSFAFRLYLGYFDTYSVTYGSLGAVMILLLWLYLTGVALLVGGEMNAVIEDAAARRGASDAKEHGERSPDADG